MTANTTRQSEQDPCDSDASVAVQFAGPNSAAYSNSVYQSIREVDWDEWNSVRDASRDVFMDPRFIEAVENSLTDCRYRHVLVRDGSGRPVATACLSSFVLDGASLTEGASRKLFELVGRVVPWFVRSKLILCGLPVSAGQSHVRFAPEADRETVLRIIDSVARRFASAEWARLIMFKEIDPDGCRELAPLVSLGYRRADSFPMNLANSDFRDFDDYVAHVNSDKRRKIRRSQQKFLKSGLRVVQLYGRDGAADIYTDEVHRLYEAVADGSEVQFEHVPPDLLRELARRLPDNTVFTFVYSGNQIVGFTFWLISDRTFHALLVGMNYEVNSKCELYFNLSYQSIDFGLKRRAQEVCIGQSTDELKHRKLGCYQVPMSIFVKGGRWSMRLVLKFAFAWIFPARPITFPRETVDLDSERNRDATIADVPDGADAGR
jgi:predicted N-acyltransferase